uniref:Uncharacterized protein n=1 Tax=Romanomermis culicivorax TaxID=13658 RepID=A0A915IJ10_ROMCU
MGVKRKAPGDDRAQAEKHQQTAAKSPEGALSDPTEAEETGNIKAKTRMHNFTIRTFNCLVDLVEVNKARIRATTEKNRDAGKDLHAIRPMTNDLPQHADQATEPQIDRIRHRCHCQTP